MTSLNENKEKVDESKQVRPIKNKENLSHNET